MCIILGKLKNNKHFDIDTIETAMKNNPDGFSYTIFDDRYNLIETYKTLDHKNFIDRYKNIILNLDLNYTIIYHFRIATNGAICEKNTHPFENKNNILWHNGIFAEFASDKKHSDTKAFLNKYITNKTINFSKICEKIDSNKIIVYNKETKNLYYSDNFITLDDGNIASNTSYINYKYLYNYNYYDDDYNYFDTDLNDFIDDTIATLKKIKKIKNTSEKMKYLLDIYYDIDYITSCQY